MGILICIIAGAITGGICIRRHISFRYTLLYLIAVGAIVSAICELLL